jgi:hypothetical protein
LAGELPFGLNALAKPRPWRITWTFIRFRTIPRYREVPRFKIPAEKKIGFYLRIVFRNLL